MSKSSEDVFTGDKTSTNTNPYGSIVSSSTINSIIPSGGTLAITGDETVSGTLTSSSFIGSLTGNVTGNISGSSGSCTGNAATATTATNFNNGTASSSGGNVTCSALIGPQGNYCSTTSSVVNTFGNSAYPSKLSGITTTVDSATGQIYLGTSTSNPTINTGSGGSGGTINAATVNAALTGNVTGNVTGSSGSCTGNAATATTATNFNNGTSSSSGGNVTCSTLNCTTINQNIGFGFNILSSAGRSFIATNAAASGLTLGNGYDLITTNNATTTISASSSINIPFTVNANNPVCKINLYGTTSVNTKLNITTVNAMGQYTFGDTLGTGISFLNAFNAASSTSGYLYGTGGASLDYNVGVSCCLTVMYTGTSYILLHTKSCGVYSGTGPAVVEGVDYMANSTTSLTITPASGTFTGYYSVRYET